jgi:hypothetical protein
MNCLKRFPFEKTYVILDFEKIKMTNFGFDG